MIVSRFALTQTTELKSGGHTDGASYWLSKPIEPKNPR